MAVPKKRISRTRRDKRRTHKKLALVNPSTCPKCGEPVMPHRICSSCGNYRDRTMIETED